MDGGDDELNEVVFAGLVKERVPEVAAVPGGPLVKLRRVIRRLIKARKHRGDEDGGVVERVLSCGDKLFLHGLWRKMHVRTDGTKVGNDAKNALGLGAVVPFGCKRSRILARSLGGVLAACDA